MSFDDNQAAPERPLNIEIPEEARLVEAKTAIFLLKNARLCTKNEYTQWLLKNLFQPFTRKKCEVMDILYLSRNRKRIWKPETKKNYSKDVLNHRAETLSSTTKLPKRSSSSSTQTSEPVYIITPRTQIMTLNKQYRLVYIIDLSSSLATVGNTNADLLISVVFKTMRDSLKGLVQPFSLQISDEEKAIIRPSLCLTVMADCSQFASNVNIIPMLVAHPTMRVFMQNAIITTKNIDHIIDKLYAEFQSFQEDTTSFRKLLKRRRPNMGYNLDVSGEVLDATSLPSNIGIPQDTDHQTPRRTKTDKQKAGQKKEEPSYYASKKEVWGIGKSGANISRILHAGYFALSLLPQEGRPQLILITDGAMKSNVHDNTFVQQFAEEDVTCHIVQIGYKDSFIPGRNFGFLPDNEILRFLSRATGGTFMFSEECEEIRDSDIHQSSATDRNDEQKSEFGETIRIVPTASVQCPPPNVYHQKFLFRETYLSKHGYDSYSQSGENQDHNNNLRDLSGPSGVDIGREITAKHNFPWDPNANPPESDWRLLKYREYILPAEFSHIIAARTREGFSLQSITFDNGNGTSKSGPSMHNLSSIDLDPSKKERIQISMVLYWQPNVTIEYRIRATWLPSVIGTPGKLKGETLLLSSGIFSRAKIPKAEILVRTDTGFAHMLQNWDVFRRRAQMMGVVTGSIYFGESYAAPAYAKIEKLKSYLINIFEGDETLKSIIGFNSKFLSTWATGDTSLTLQLSPRYENTLRRSAFLESFQAFWEKVNATECRSRTRCWYDYNCLDMLIGDISPYMSPKFTSIYNQDFALNVEDEIMKSITSLKEVIKGWADFESTDGTFVKFIHGLLATPSHDENSKDYFSEYGRLITLRLLFFNVDVLARRRTFDNIVRLLKSSEKTNMSSGSSTGSESDHNDRKSTDRRQTENISRSKAWYLPVAMWLTGEYIVRDYLQHMTWSWQTDNHQDQFHKDNRMMPIHDLAFQFLCQTRLDQGYRLVSPFPDSTHFYQEISLPNRDGRESLCAIQYFIWKDADSGRITTELWIEPSGTLAFNQYELVKKWTVDPDRKTISQLVTFDQMYAVGRSKGKGDFKDKRDTTSDTQGMDDDTVVMRLPHLFDISSVLRNNKFVVTSFKCPIYKTQPIVQQDDQEAVIDDGFHFNSDFSTSTELSDNGSVYNPEKHNIQLTNGLRSGIHSGRVPTSPASTLSLPTKYTTIKELCPRPDPVLSRSKEAIARLSPKAQNYALMHYYIENSMEIITDGEIIMSHHNKRKTFWRELQEALNKATSNHLSGVRMTPSLQKLRCFVKTFDERSFVVVLLPSLEAIVSGLSLLSDSPCKTKEKDCAGLDQEDMFVDYFIFECLRQKPMRPTKTTLLFSSPLDEENRSRIESLNFDDDVTMTNMDYLIHQPDGLGETIRPQILQGNFSSCSGQSQISEKTLRVAQDIMHAYSKSFVKSFYTCLLSGFPVIEEDLSKVLEICNESVMSIDITEFVNIFTLQKRDPGDWDYRERSVQAKFTTIFRQYFEPVQTTSEKPTDLFYYKPTMSRLTTHTQNQGSIEDKISSLIDLIAYAQIPLLIRLECSYEVFSEKGTMLDTGITIPVSFLPTSYLGHLKDGTPFNFEHLAISPKSAPLDSGSVSVYLRFVCLNIPQSDGINYTTAISSVSPIRESLIESMNSQPACFLMLNQDQQGALAETEARIKWLLTEETIHGLLKADIITRPVLEYVEYQLGQGNPFVDFPTSTTVPFHFVKNWAESRRRFMNELLKNKDDSTTYSLRRVDDYFYASEEKIYSMRQESPVSNESSPASQSEQESTESSKDQYATFEEDERIDNFCDGLGISIGATVSVQEDPIENEKFIPFHSRPLYWLILVPKENYVQIYFYSKFHTLIDRSEFLRRVKNNIIRIQNRTNQIMLLESLQETRVCSKFLEAPSSEEEERFSDSDDSDSPDDNSPVHDNPKMLFPYDRFKPGQFECPVLFTKRFPLHWRLQPNTTLKYLTSDVLRLFTVTNRPHMFVIERDDSIVYCKIYEKSNQSPQDESDRANKAQSANTSTRQNVEDGLFTSTTSSIKQEFGRKPPPSPRNKALAMKPSESKELVLEVHGVELPVWVEKEFVNLIENRIVSHITLNEVQQFFSRNPTTKPTLADVKFILPIEKMPTNRKILRIPSLVIKPYTLMRFLKQALGTDNIKPFSGPIVSEAIESYHENTFHPKGSFGIQKKREETLEKYIDNVQEVQYSDYCFYYNCTKRVPGTSTPLELSSGQGLAGICLTLLDSTGKPVNLVQTDDSYGTHFDPEVIKHCLDEDFQEIGSAQSFYCIWIDIWVTGLADNASLMEYICECYQHALCDYLIEKTVNHSMTAALSETGALQRAITSHKEWRLGDGMRKRFIESITYVLQKAAEWKSPTVCSFDQPVHTTPWCMDELIVYLDSELRKIDVSLRPTVAWTSVQNDVFKGENETKANKKWELYRSSHQRQRQILQSNIQLVAISGLNELVERLGCVPRSYEIDRRTSAGSDNSSYHGRSRRSSNTSSAAGLNGNKKLLRLEDRGGHENSRTSSAARSISGINLKGHDFQKADPAKHCFLVMVVDAERLSTYTYNWPDSASMEILNGITQMAARQEVRTNILSNILHQKMGLFHHSEPINKVVEEYATLSNLLPCPYASLNSSSNYLSAVPPSSLIGSPKQQKKTRQSEVSSKNENSSSGKSLRRNTGNSTATIPSTCDLKDIIAHPAIPLYDSLENSKDSITYPCSELDNVLEGSIADSVSDTPSGRDGDILRRHGQPFLETYLKSTRIQTVHQKALQVHLKWRRRYVDSKTPVEYTEKMTSSEIGMILRSSRMLHFCRTPLLFTNPDEEWNAGEEGSSNRKITTDWYKNLAGSLMAEYAKYLERVDLQLVDLTNSDGTAEDIVKPSVLCIAKNLRIEYPPTYLLRVFEGGSIICEISLTSGFVSVTLYSLHRQYGRLGYSRFRHESRSTKIANLKRFEENSGRLKQLVHINSFVYDFHLRHIQNTLESPLGSIPPDLNILDVIRKFSILNMTPATYSQNRLVHGFYEFESETSANLFFGCLFRNSPLHGLSNILAENVSVGVSVSSNSMSFSSQDDDKDSTWRYTLIICPVNDTGFPDKSKSLNDQSPVTSKILLEYFILVVYQGSTNTKSIAKVNQKGSASNLPYDMLQPEKDHSQEEIVHSARKRIDAIVSEVTFYCKRSDDWRKLYSFKIDSKKSEACLEEQYSTLIKLMSKFERTDITEIDSNMKSLLCLRLDWNSALDMIANTKGNIVKEIRERDSRHMFLYSARYMDFMIHLQIDQGMLIKGWVVSREPKNMSEKYREPEREQIASIGRALCYFIWLETTNKQGYLSRSSSHRSS
ncbi:hypothetical protein CLU79DRAFT_888752 [Phycomyces nitens]|nr:hypothetical protein CLU79DRAFT_888752 [Phycomyces nitens]